MTRGGGYPGAEPGSDAGTGRGIPPGRAVLAPSSGRRGSRKGGPRRLLRRAVSGPGWDSGGCLGVPPCRGPGRGSVPSWARSGQSLAPLGAIWGCRTATARQEAPPQRPRYSQSPLPGYCPNTPRSLSPTIPWGPDPAPPCSLLPTLPCVGPSWAPPPLPTLPCLGLWAIDPPFPGALTGTQQWSVLQDSDSSGHPARPQPPLVLTQKPQGSLASICVSHGAPPAAPSPFPGIATCPIFFDASVSPGLNWVSSSVAPRDSPDAQFDNPITYRDPSPGTEMWSPLR